MSALLQTLQAAHNARSMVAVAVPEYGVTWHFPSITVADQQAIRSGINKNDETALMISALMHLAHDAEGNKVFDLKREDRVKVRAELDRMDPRVLLRIVTEAGGGLSASISAELAGVDLDSVRAVLVAALGDQAPELAGVIEDADEEFIRRGLAVIAEVHAASVPGKNG